MKKYTGNNKGGPTVENIINMLTINWLMVDEKPLNSTRRCYLDMGLIKHFWYLILVEQQKETVTVYIYVLTSQMTPLKATKTMLVSAIRIRYQKCFIRPMSK
jgi:hypothetical protein